MTEATAKNNKQLTNSEIQIFSQIQSVTKLLGVRHLKEVADFCVFSFEHEEQLDYSTLDKYRQLYYELVINITDACSFIIENEKIIPQKNKITLIKPFQLQSTGSYDDSLPASLSKGYIIYFTSDFLKNIYELEQLPIFDKQKVTSFTFENCEMNDFEHIAKEIYLEYRNYNGITSKKIIRNYLEIILLKLQQKNLTTINLGYSNAPKQLYFDFLNAVNKNFQTLTTVKEYAQLLNVSAKHLSETVKKESNINALSIINEMRMSYSKTLLLQTNKNINEIAQELNFYDANNFSTYFKKHTEETPLQFRKNQR
jgi:AraC family transcriptional activator of pobA